jgi:hypothetical protein
MNLGKLLATGKSLISGQSSAKYRANKNVYLPKFSAAKNPFAHGAPPASAPELPVTPAAPSLAEVKTRPLPTLTPAKPEKAEKSASPGWVSKISSVSIWRGWQAEAKAQHPPVQVELSLKDVKVIHNDLSDADVEVVPIKSRPALVKAARPEAADHEKAWELSGEPLLKVN